MNNDENEQQHKDPDATVPKSLAEQGISKANNQHTTGYRTMNEICAPKFVIEEEKVLEDQATSDPSKLGHKRVRRMWFLKHYFSEDQNITPHLNYISSHSMRKHLTLKE